MNEVDLESIRQEARILASMRGPGRGVILEHLLSRLAGADPAMAELFGDLITGLEKHDPTSLPLLGATLREIARKTGQVNVDRREEIDVLIIAPKAIEEQAVLDAFGMNKAHKVQTGAAKHTGYRGEVDGYSILVCSPHNDGNVRMALFTAEWLREWQPKLGALVGMAGGREGDVKLGDIVLATSILDYQIVRRIATPDGPVDKNRFIPHGVPDFLLTNFSHVDEDKWRVDMKEACAPVLRAAPAGKKLALGQFNKWRPTMKEGIVLAGSTLVEDGSIDQMADAIHDRAMAVEMEGAGFAAAMTASRIPWVSLRGIADMGGHPDFKVPEEAAEVTTEELIRPRTKEWQLAVTFAAAFRLRSVLPDINVLG